jgi:hypothetical protein
LTKNAPYKGLLAFIAAEIDASLGVVGGKDAKTVIWNFSAHGRLNRGEPQLEFGQLHLTIDIQNASRPRHCPTQERTATRNGQAYREAEPAFADTTGRIHHRQTSFR